MRDRVYRVLIVILLGMAVFFGILAYREHKPFLEAKISHEAIQKTAVVPESDEDASDPMNRRIDFALLKEVNPDIIGWLYIQQIGVDEPILHGKTDREYLSKGFDGKYPSNVSLNRRMIGFGMSNVPENNWEAVMVTILHYLSIRMDYNKKFQKATHLVIDETQVISKKPGSARQLNNAVITFRKFGGIVTMAMQNVTAALSNQTLIELFQNCSYKTFLDQGGVDAQSLAAIQEFSAKEFKALSSGNVGEGVMVWNKKVVMFDALISKENVLYKNYSTNFHEKAKEQKMLSFEEDAVPKFGTTEKTESHSVLSEKEEELILEVSCIMDITVTDVERLFNQDTETCLGYLKRLEKKGKLKEVNGRYRKVE